MQQILQAYADHHGRWLKEFQRTLSRRAQDPTIWEDGVLDLVSPADLQVRSDLGKTGTELPWGGRGDLELYWRVMYAAFAEFLALTDPGHGSGEGIRPIRDVVLNCHEAGRKEVLQDIIAGAGHQLRLRSGQRMRLEPIVRFSEVAVERNPALIVGYAFNGKLLVSRETAPDVKNGIDWQQDTRTGRWCAMVMPWQAQPKP